MKPIILFNKPFQVLSQFSPEGDKTTLAKFIDQPNYYPAGRLDYDSEGLMLLTDNGAIQHLIAAPENKLAKTYWVQVEGLITNDAITQLTQGIILKDGKTQPAEVNQLLPPDIPARVPPIRERQSIPTSWLSLTIKEGKNRQVRRMTAAVGFPTLRLIRTAIGPYSIDTLPVGEWRFSDLTPDLTQQAVDFEQRRLSQKQKPNKHPSPHRRRHRHSPRPK